MPLVNFAFNIGSENEQQIGVPPELLDELVRQHADYSETQKKLIRKLEADLELSQNQMRTALLIIGETDVPSEALGTKLVEIARQLKVPSPLAITELPHDQKFESLISDAEQAFQAGELAKADRLLADAEREQAEAAERSAVNAANTCARRGQIALVRLRYLEAANHFATAHSKLVPGSVNEGLRLGYLYEEAAALYYEGYRSDNAALMTALERIGQLLGTGTGNLTDHLRSQSHILRGAILNQLGQRKNDTSLLVQGIAATRAALLGINRERQPLEWATVQNNIGTALHALGDRETGTARLLEAVNAYRASLNVKSRHPDKLGWSRTRNNLGGALGLLGERERSKPRLREAINVLQRALKECSQDDDPLQWASLQNSLGCALRSLGAMLNGTTKLKQAIVALNKALQERTQVRVPLQWATTMNNLGNALQTLGAREADKALIEESIAAYNAALEERTRERVPVLWAETKNNLGFALRVLARHETGIESVEKSISAYREALEIRTPETLPYYWEESSRNLAVSIMLLRERQQAKASASSPD